MSITVEEIENLVKQLADQRALVEELKRPYSEANEKLEEIEQKVAGALVEMGKDGYKSEYGTVSRRTEWRYNLPTTPEDKAAFFQFLREKGVFEQMATVNSNTYNSFCKAEQEAAVERDPASALSFRIPGVPEPKQRQVLSFRKK